MSSIANNKYHKRKVDNHHLDKYNDKIKEFCGICEKSYNPYNDRSIKLHNKKCERYLNKLYSNKTT